MRMSFGDCTMYKLNKILREWIMFSKLHGPQIMSACWRACLLYIEWNRVLEVVNNCYNVFL